MSAIRSLLSTFIILILGLNNISQAQLKTININITQEAIKELESHPYTNESVLGTLDFNNTIYNNVELHYRGAYNLSSLIKTSSYRNWKVKTPKQQKFENRREWNFNFDLTIRQYLAYQLLKNAGVPCVSAELVTFSVNNEGHCIFLKFDDPDNKDWLSDTFGDDNGDLYKAAYDMPNQTKYFGDLSYLGALDKNYYLHYRKQTNTDGDLEFDYSSIRKFTDFINNTSDQDFEANIVSHFNVNAFIKYLVVANFIAHWDGYPHRPKNYLLYDNPKDGRWQFIPWDLDATFQSIGHPINTEGSVFYYLDHREPYSNAYNEPLDRPLPWRLMKIKRFRDQYIYEYQQALKTYLNINKVTADILATQNYIDANAPTSSLRRFDTSVDEVLDFINIRYANVSEELSYYKVDNTSILPNLAQFGNMQIYPNPASNIINIELPDVTSSNAKIEILNMLGQCIYSTSIYTNNRPFQVDLTSVPSGQYIVVIYTKLKKYTQKLIINKQ